MEKVLLVHQSLPFDLLDELEVHVSVELDEASVHLHRHLLLFLAFLTSSVFYVSEVIARLVLASLDKPFQSTQFAQLSKVELILGSWVQFRLCWRVQPLGCLFAAQPLPC